ncbi:MAG: hypothetical protein HON14_08895 [Rhodospirillaceae bacterium]|jgi:hypothetical protein|nr:hypothetical protein [Rhodospirillaceae bacterium]MBT4588890.1 hypothetical protein [Rhodospirillaceae bacterium]MBT4939234.1 hypothetical protein [Rhodospirillaceae bacterium]MBT7268096.1 hypothetical protein [Rhodospirillaceae bacterium]
MVEENKHTDQEDFEFVQNLFDQVKPELASPELKAQILMSAPSGKSATGFAELLEYLWPFGALWRPAAGLAMAAMFGIVLGLSDPLAALSSVDAEDELTEEIVAFAIAADGQLEEIQ